MTTSTPQIHEEYVRSRRSITDRLLEAIGHHRHYVVKTTWSLDDSLWSTDPNALHFCACGAWRPLWGWEDLWLEFPPDWPGAPKL